MLSVGDVFGAMLTGTVVFGVGGLAAGRNVVFFFVSSSLLSRWHAGRKEQIVGNKFSTSSTRDLRQTVAIGGAGALTLLGYTVFFRTARLGSLARVWARLRLRRQTRGQRRSGRSALRLCVPCLPGNGLNPAHRVV